MTFFTDQSTSTPTQSLTEALSKAPVQVTTETPTKQWLFPTTEASGKTAQGNHLGWIFPIIKN